MPVAFTVRNPKTTALRALNYSPASEAFRRKASGSNCSRLGSLLANMGPAYGSVFTRLDCERTYGVELLSQGDMFSTEPQGRVIRRDSMPVPEDHRIKKWQVLVAGAGTLGPTELFGRSILADGRLTDKYVGPHAMVLTFREERSPLSLYCYAFLSTAAGIGCVRATSYGTKVLGLRSDLLSDLPIPLASESVVEKIACLIAESVEYRESFAAEVSAAREPILQIPEVKEAIGYCKERRRRCLVWHGDLPTISAWNYASTGGALEYLQRKWSGRLSDIVRSEDMFYGPRFARIPSVAPYGIDFESQRDVFLLRPILRRIVHPGCADRLLFVPDSALLVGGQGQLEEGNLFGRVELAAFNSGRGAITEAIFRILTPEKSSELMFAYLSTELGLAFMRNAAVGTSVPKMNPALLEQIPIPDTDSSTRAKIVAHVRSAIHAKEKANAAESEAIRLVSQEIIPKWLN